MRSGVYVFGLLLAIASCRPVPTQVGNQAAVANKFTEVAIRDIHTFKDQRQTQNLLPYLGNPQPAVRAEAALAFASVQDTTITPQLAQLLTDPEPTVRQNAAFALGQTGGPAVLEYLTEAFANETYPAVLATLYEALGKETTAAGLTLFIQNQIRDTVVVAGQQWGLYRAGMRGISSAQATERSVERLQPQNSYYTRLAAAHTLARTPNTDLTAWEQTLVALLQTEKSGIIRSAVATALGKVKSATIAPALAKVAVADKDYRVRLSAIRALSKIPYADGQSAVFKSLTDANPHVALVAAEYLLANGKPAGGKKLAASAENALNWRTKATLLQAALRHAADNEKAAIRRKIESRYESSANKYEKAHLLKAMSEDMEFFPVLSDVLLNEQEPVLKTAAAEALTEMRNKENFNPGLKSVFAEILQNAVKGGDVATVGIIAAAIRNPASNLRNDFDSFDFLEDAQENLTLPRDTETFIELQKTINYVTGNTDIEVPESDFTQPINWQLVQSIPANQKVRIITSKGEIMLQLDVNSAPGSVANFVTLARKGFYDGKTMHRVVPNFVVQGGCPRGDGWGSTDYNIRSEFAPDRFLQGSVGLASAGKDTESCQWFITHTATPHLDGRYTNFAQVIKGMDVVHRLEIGDKIESVVLY